MCNVTSDLPQETTDPMETHFLLADNVYCKASVPPTDKVCLWLGVSARFLLNWTRNRLKQVRLDENRI